MGDTPAPAPAIRNVELSHLRHNLRTPVNHVLGYAELLMEDAAEAGDAARRDLLKKIRADARLVLDEINRTLGNRDAVERPEIPSLLERIRPLSADIVERVAVLRETPGGPPDVGRDLDRIASAATSLVRLLEDPSAALEVEDAPAPRAAAAQTSAARILVVDDNPSNRNMLCRRLVRQGYHVEEAANGADALDRVATEPFDLVLLDIMMPVMDGFETLARMKADRRMRTVPVVVISALNEMDGAVRAIQMGAEDYLFKPFDPVLLRARIGALVEKKRLMEELGVQQKLASLGALTSGIAHEIKNPLNFVLNFAELSTDLLKQQRACLDSVAGSVPPSTLKELRDIAVDLEENIDRIRHHGARADGIIASMLAHSRGQPGERSAIDLNSLVREYVSLAFHGMRARDHTFQATIEASYDPAVGIVDVVPQDLSRVFLNVAGNAFDALRQKARNPGPGFQPVLNVTTRSLGDRVEVRLRDNGIGIHKDALDRIFDPFFTTKPAGEGTGLGLSISHEIVVGEHGGEMRADSVEGEYAEFSITLPRRAAQTA
jgi:two-component system, NtrC family, sensor kinase